MTTYRELRDFINTLDADELDLKVAVYSGDVDEAWRVFEIGRNTDDEMGGQLTDLSEGYPLLLI